MTKNTRSGDEAMIAYLAGDDAVADSAKKVWQATERIVAAQQALDSAGEAYRDAIRDSGILAEHAEHISAVLILRLSRAWALTEPASHESHRDDGP